MSKAQKRVTDRGGVIKRKRDAAAARERGGGAGHVPKSRTRGTAQTTAQKRAAQKKKAGTYWGAVKTTKKGG